jgi:hypothetical protein
MSLALNENSILAAPMVKRVPRRLRVGRNSRERQRVTLRLLKGPGPRLFRVWPIARLAKWRPICGLYDLSHEAKKVVLT